MSNLQLIYSQYSYGPLRR